METENKSVKLITKAQFARNVGVTRGAISLASSRQPPLVYVDPESGKIDPEHPMNIAYITNREERTSNRQKKANLSKAIAKELTAGDLEEMLKGLIQNITGQAVSTPAQPAQEEKQQPTSTAETTSEVNAATHSGESKSPQPAANANSGNDLQGYDPKIIQAAVQEKGQKAALDNLKIQEKQIKIAELSGELARRDHVETFIGIIYGTINNHFLPLDFRLTATIMDICGLTDPKIKLEISEAIAKETTTGLAQVKKKAEEFALSLNPALF